MSASPVSLSSPTSDGSISYEADVATLLLMYSTAS
jgi:hypothetical protein